MNFADNAVKLNGTELTEGQQLNNGDILSYSLEWTLDNALNIAAEDVFYYDLTSQLNGVNLLERTVTTTDAVYTIKDNVLYIKLLAVGQDKSGTFNLEGKLDVNSNDVSDTGAFTLKFFDEVPVIVSNLQPQISIDKSRDNTQVYLQNGKYYQKFKVTLKSNNADSKNVKLTDTGGSIYDFSNLTPADFSVVIYDTSNGYAQSAGTITDSMFNNNQNGFVIDYGTVESNKIIDIFYSVPLDLNGYVTADSSAKTNSITAVSSNGGTDSDTEEAYAQLPSIEKTGAYNETTGVITWTVTVKSSALFDGKNFTITDIPDTGLTAEQINTALGGNNTISKSEMQYDALSNSYSYTFNTTVTEAQKNSVSDVYIKNKVTAQYNDPTFTIEDYGDVNISADYAGVTKTHIENTDKSVTWDIVIPVPSVCQKITVKDYFTINNYDYTLSQLFNNSLSGSNMTITANGTEYSYADVAVTESEDGNGLQFYFKEDFLNSVAGGDIIISYTTPKAIITEDVNTVTNKVSVNIDGTSLPEVTDTYLNGNPINITAAKAENSNTSWLGNNLLIPMTWQISINDGARTSGTRQFCSGDVITVTDTIPDGLVLVDGKYHINIRNWVEEWTAAEFTNQGCLEMSQSGNVVTFTIKVNDYLASQLNSWDSPLYLYYGTQMTTEKYNQIYSEFGKHDFTNNAVVSVKNGSETIGEEIEISCTQSVEADPNKILTKAIKEIQEATPTDPNLYVIYEVKVNSEAHDLASGDDLIVKDTLGSKLEIKGTPVITPAANGENSEINGNEITFHLKDNTAYTITYKAKVNVIDSDAEYSNAEITAMFGNTIEVSLSGENSVEKSVCLSEEDYRSDASYGYVESESMITIKGSKIWKNDSGSVRPSEIKVVLTVHKTTKGGTETTQEKTYTFPAPDSGDSWTYEIKKLVTLTADETKYTYDIKEVSVDGYTVSYSTDKLTGITKIGDTDEFVIDITNTWNVDEKGKLTVNKVWDDNNNSEKKRPSSIDITVKTTDGVSYTSTKTLDKDGTALVFEDLPLYKYSRDTDGKLVREPLRYVVEESDCFGYKVSYSVSGDFTLTDNTTDISAEKTVTVTNTLITNPTDPDEPEQPEDPDEPEQPEDPYKPSQPDKPIYPIRIPTPVETTIEYPPFIPNQPDDAEDISPGAGMEAEGMTTDDSKPITIAVILSLISVGAAAIICKKM